GAPFHSDYTSNRLRAFIAELRRVDGDDPELYGVDERSRPLPIGMVRLSVAVMALSSNVASTAVRLNKVCVPAAPETSTSCRLLARRLAASRDSLASRMLALALLAQLQPESQAVEQQRTEQAWL